MKFSYNWLQSFFDKKLPEPKKLADLLLLHFAEVEEVKKEGNDFILDIDIRPNRAGDCLSHLGVVREIGAILNFNAGKKTIWKLKEDNKLKADKFISVEVKDKKACPRYIARVVNGIKVGQSPKYIQDRLKACGLRPINNIVDITNYVMLEIGQPLHAFDLGKIQNNKIIVRYAKAKEKITTLDNQNIQLDPKILLISDSEKPLAIAGIKGGKSPEIDKKTKTVILESANFNLHVVRHGSKKTNLRTDASIRFEHGLDPNLAEVAINRAAYLLQKETGGKVAKGLVDVYPKKVLPKKIKLDFDKIENILGVKIPKTNIKTILHKLNFKVVTANSRYLIIKIPTFRLDVSFTEDLIEEIGRIYGYNKIPAVFPIASLIPPKRNENIFWENKAKNILIQSGFSEVYNYNFISREQAHEFGFSEKNLIELENPLSAEQQYLVSWRFPAIIKNTKENLKYFEKVKIFELGKVYSKQSGKQGSYTREKFTEKRMFSGAISQKSPQKNNENFYELKGVLDLLFKNLGVKDIKYEEWLSKNEGFWKSDVRARIKSNEDDVGFIGTTNNGITIFEINFEKLQKLATEEKEYNPISKHPEAIRDISISVPQNVKAGDVLNKIKDSGSILVRRVELFDTYESGGGKKRLAFHIIFQAQDRTLQSEELDKVFKKIINNLDQEAGWEVRRLKS